MDFVVHENHDEHDISWTLYSSLHHTRVCLGCIVETIENTELLPLQRKPALTEFLRMLTQQSSELMQLFMKEERIVWHVVTILLESFSLEDESYMALSVNVLLKMLQMIGSEDLVTEILDAIVKKIEMTADHKKLEPHYILLGKMLYQLPALTETLLTHYDWLLNALSLDLCKVGETVQSSIAYIFIFLCDESQIVKLHARTLQQVHSGILTMLSSAGSLPVLINGLGLLKKLLSDSTGCNNLMTLNKDGVTLLTCMKKLLLSKKDVLQSAVSQILSIILNKDNYLSYATTILDSDIVEFLFESLHTENTVQIECILKVLQKLARVEQFYKRCHSVYGVESVLRAVSTSIELKNPSLLNHGYILLAEILNRHPEDVPLFLSSSVVQKCLSQVKHGLSHYQNAVNHTAQDAFLAMLRKKYLLLPVPFQELTEMFTMVTKRKLDQLKLFWDMSETRQMKNIEMLSCSLVRYLDLTIKCCYLVKECRGDLATCESNFAAPGTGDLLSPTDTFVEKLFNAGQHVCDVLSQKSADRIHSVQLYEKVLELICCLNDLDTGKSHDLVYQLILAGFIIRLIDVMVKLNSQQLTNLMDRFLKLTVECCHQHYMLPVDRPFINVLDVHHFKWPFNCLKQVFLDGNVDTVMVEAYLVIIYLSCKYCNCEGRPVYGEIICSILNGHMPLEQMSSLGRKLYIYLLSYVSTYEGVCVRETIQDGLECLPSVMERPASEWYTHDICMLIWVFDDPVLAITSAKSVIDAFLENTSIKEIQHILETEGCLENDTLLRFCSNKNSLSSLVTSLTNKSAEIVSKIFLLLEEFISRSADSSFTGVECKRGEDAEVQECMSKQLNFLFEKTTDVLLNVFLKNYSNAQDHNICGLLELMLVLIKYTKSAYTISVKILYHVLNVLSRKEKQSQGLEKACLLSVLAAVTSKSESQSQSSVCAIVVQHEGFMSYLQTCFDNSDTDIIYCISCDLLMAIIQEKKLKCDNTVQVDIVRVVNSVCMDSGDYQVASMNLLSALFSVNMTSSIVKVAGRIYPAMYRTLYIQLQQSCLQEESDTAYGAGLCMRNLILHLLQSDRDLGEELLEQPWNIILLEVLLDLSSTGHVMEHQLCLLSLFTEFKTGCSVIKSTPNLVDKIMKFVQTISKNTEEHFGVHLNNLLKHLKTNFEDVLSDENIKWLKEKRNVISVDAL
ncbi:uncharacterized protein LOC132735152 [Ruditapes philippinarum]|uniref:uncharacterized protein LOC132735152 n=1 Tax=Ruditapes philippinarum TaxID=129788 RepID=UPI00295BECAF|nr:uncharacterized protein LOC132735152 [Ruditapes philippinarum]